VEVEEILSARRAEGVSTACPVLIRTGHAVKSAGGATLRRFIEVFRVDPS